MLAMSTSEIQVEHAGSPNDNDSINFKGGYDKDPTASSSSLVSEGLRIRHGTLLTEELSLDEIIVDFVYDFETRHQVVLYKGGKVNVIRKNPARRRHFLTSNEPKFSFRRIPDSTKFKIDPVHCPIRVPCWNHGHAFTRKMH